MRRTLAQSHGLRPHRRAAARPRDGAGLHRQRDRRPRARERARRALRSRARRACSPRRATSARSSRAEYGGAGLDHVTYGLIVEEIGRGDSAMRTVVSVQTSLVCGSILRWGTERAEAPATCRKLCSGEWLGCFGLTEPDAGSDAASLRTRAHARRRRLAAQRREDVDLARQPREGRADLRPDRSRRCATAASRAFSSTPTSPASSAAEIHHKMGLHASDTAAIALDDVFVADADVLGEVGDGFKVAMSALDGGRYSVAAGCVGICQGCLDASVAYATRARAVRPADRELPARAGDARRDEGPHRRRAAARPARRLRCATRAGRARPRRRSPSSTRPRPRCGAPTRRSRSTARAGYVDDHPVERWFRDVARDDALRGHLADPAAHHRPRADRHRRDGPGRARPRPHEPRGPPFHTCVSRLPPFQRFLDAHRDDVLRFLVASLGRHDADDAFQETFLSALRAYERLRARLEPARLGPDDRPSQGARRPPRAPAPPAAGRRARRRRRARRGAHDGEPRPTGDEHWERVRALPPRQRAVLTLRYAADLTHAEIAQALGCSEEAARRAASDGLKTLQTGALRCPCTRLTCIAGESAALAARTAARAADEGVAEIAYAVLDAPVGRLVVAATRARPRADRLRARERRRRQRPRPDRRAAVAEHRRGARAARRPRAASSTSTSPGRRRDFDLPIDWRLARSAFTRRVLEATARIPFGATSTYRDVAIAAGSPKAFRAAGSALGSNPLPIVVPCHRVLASGGEHRRLHRRPGPQARPAGHRGRPPVGGS